MTPSAALVLASGGLDSSTLLVHTLAEGVSVPTALWVDYGQRHVREQHSAAAVAAHYGVTLISVDLHAFGANLRSALTQHSDELPHGHYTEQSMGATVVPGRNALMLSIAAGVASSRGADRVLIAAHRGDHPVYPDCREDFIAAMGHALRLAYGVDVHAPFAALSKAQIVTEGMRLGVPFELTWSCYEGGEQHCGRCGTCVERAEAFSIAGVIDPTSYADADYWWQEAVRA